MKRKVCVVITARPSYSRIKSALKAINEHPELELQLVVAASALLERYGSAVRSIQEDGFEITRQVYTILEGENLLTSAKSTGLGLMELATIFNDLKPDVVVSIADRFETLATAVAAAYMNIPLCHIQGGEVTGSIDEKVRHAVTKLADLHFVSTQKASKRVVKMGENPEKVFVTGCPSIDLAAEILKNTNLSFDPFKKYGGVGDWVNVSNGYLVVLQHPVTTEYEKARSHINETLYAIKEIGMPTLWFWPNVDAGSDGTSKGIRAFRENEKPKNIHFFKNMLPEDFLRLIHNSKCIVGNSSVAIRECSFLGEPAVNIGTRQNGRERGKNVIDVGYRRDAIFNGIVSQIKNGKFDRDYIYGDGNSGEKIAKLLATCDLHVEKKLTY